MRFKEFLLKENNDSYLAVKTGDILTSLQTAYEDSGVMSRKDVDDLLHNIVIRIRPLLKTKSNITYQKTLQKVATNIMRYLDPQVPNAGIDSRNLMLSCLKELQNLLANKDSAINKINKDKEEKLPAPVAQSINQELKNSSTTMKQAEVPETGLDNSNAPPMAGDGARTLNVL